MDKISAMTDGAIHSLFPLRRSRIALWRGWFVWPLFDEKDCHINMFEYNKRWGCDLCDYSQNIPCVNFLWLPTSLWQSRPTRFSHLWWNCLSDDWWLLATCNKDQYFPRTDSQDIIICSLSNPPKFTHGWILLGAQTVKDEFTHSCES